MKRAPFVLVGTVVGLLGVAVALGAQGSDPGADAAADLGAELDLSGTVLAEPWPRPDFTLTTTDGEPFDFAAETAGRLTLLFFGYTSCPDICPIHLATLAGAIERGDVPDPIVVFVGVDAARDTPEVVRAFLDRYDTDFIGLVGTPAELDAAQIATGVPVAIAEPPDESGEYLVGHAAQIIAYTPDDLAHVVYPFGVRRQDWVKDLPRLATLDWDRHAG